MNSNKSYYRYHPEVLKSILSGNSVQLLTRCLKRLNLVTRGRKEDKLNRLAEYLATEEGIQYAYTKNISK